MVLAIMVHHIQHDKKWHGGPDLTNTRCRTPPPRPTPPQTCSAHIAAAGAAWKEEWNEKAYHDPNTVELVVERTAHK